MNKSLLHPPVHLPRHARLRPRFEDTFSRTAHATLAAMNASGDDIPGQRPAQSLALQRIGVCRDAVPLTIADPFDPDRTTQLACTVEMSATLAAHRRGIHVSRLGDVLARATQQAWPSLEAAAIALAGEITRTQDCPVAAVQVEGVLSYVEDGIGCARKLSLEHLTLHAGASVEAGSTSVTSGIVFQHITACPCVQQTYKHSSEDEDARSGPFLTHSQRCRTRVTLTGLDTPIPVRALLDRIDRIVVRCQNTLPRDAELQAVHRAHVRPQFLEDALRDLLVAVCGLVPIDRPDAVITVEGTSMESIHDFDISGRIAYAAADVRHLEA